MDKASIFFDDKHHYGHGIDIEDMVLFGNPVYPIGIPHHFPEEGKFRVHAAINTLLMGTKSIDYQLKELKRFRKSYEESEEQTRFYRSVERLKWAAHETCDKISKLPPAKVAPNLLLAETALIRLHASCKALAFLIMNGYYFESYSVMRLMFEQIAYAFAVHDMQMEKVTEYSVTKSISKLSNLIKSAGKIYGTLSEKAHISFQNTQHFFEWDEKGEKIVDHSIIMQSHRKSYEVLGFAFTVLDFHDAIAEYITRDYLKIFESWENLEGKLVLKKGRRRKRYSKLMWARNQLKIDQGRVVR